MSVYHVYKPGDRVRLLYSKAHAAGTTGTVESAQVSPRGNDYNLYKVYLDDLNIGEWYPPTRLTPLEEDVEEKVDHPQHYGGADNLRDDQGPGGVALARGAERLCQGKRHQVPVPSLAKGRRGRGPRQSRLVCRVPEKTVMSQVKYAVRVDTKCSHCQGTGFVRAQVSGAPRRLKLRLLCSCASLAPLEECSRCGGPAGEGPCAFVEEVHNVQQPCDCCDACRRACYEDT